jgi:hypothetical protein
MGWLANRRAKRAAEIAAAVQAALAAAAPKDETLSVTSILTEQAKLDLDRKRMEHDFEIERLKLSEADRAADRKEERERREKNKIERAKAAAYARESLAKKKAAAAGRSAMLPPGAAPFMQTCQECIKELTGRQPTNTNDMLRHATERHAIALAALRAMSANPTADEIDNAN